MSEFPELTGPRDWSTPLPWTGKPVVKTYWDWLRCCYRTDVCILLGAREEAPGVPWAEQQANKGKGKAPKVKRRDLSPQGQRQARNSPGPKPGNGTNAGRSDGTRARIRAYLKTHPDATSAEIFDAHPDCKPESIRALLHNDPQVQRVGGGTGKGSGRKAGEQSRWRLRDDASLPNGEASNAE